MKLIVTSLVCIILMTLIFLSEKILTQTSSDFIVFHQHKKSLILDRRGKQGTLYIKTDSEKKKVIRLLSAYQLQHYSVKMDIKRESKHFFKIGDCRIMVIDEPFLKDDFGFGADVLILVNSPKINLERFIKDVRPKLIVADGSNFYSYKSLWKNTSEKYDIEFHDTSTEGAYIHSK